MSNTSLRKITIPKLTQAGLGKSILEQFANIDFNFQKLANLDANSGATGASCMYISINLAAPFVYSTSTINDVVTTTDYNGCVNWQDAVSKLTGADATLYNKIKKSVDEDYEAYYALTGGSKQAYAQIAAHMLWGSERTFVEPGSTPSTSSLAGTLAEKYTDAQVEVEINDVKYGLYGNWLYKFFEIGFATSGKDVSDQLNLLLNHAQVVTPGKMIIAVSPMNGNPTSYRPVGSLAYWYLDPRYQSGTLNNADSTIKDMSCVVHWTPDSIYDENWAGKFVILNIFPTIEMGEDGKWYWNINGYNTGISPEGKQGEVGKASNFVIVERVENVDGYDPVNYPAGTAMVGPATGKFKVYVDQFSGRSSRFETLLNQQVNDFPILTADSSQALTNVKLTQSDSGVLAYDVNIESGWIDSKSSLSENLQRPEHLFRVYRVLGQDTGARLFINSGSSVISDEDDSLDHQGDPSCDEYYYPGGSRSVPNPDPTIQKLISSLNGAPAVILPGPAFAQDRTDTTYWFGTLRLVSTASGTSMLVVYCSSDGQMTTNIDEHTQAGQMMRLDAYSHKSTGDNRNKPRGLMLPIGSAAVSSDDPAESWAAHVIHSDLGGFKEMKGDTDGSRYGVQRELTSEDLKNTMGYAVDKNTTQFTEVIGKRILHIGSVNDYRTLNYVSATANERHNGAVPGRQMSSDIAGYGTSNFFGSVIGSKFVGSELHVDEPVTITRYRDLHKHKHLLTVEGDTVIGPHVHINAKDLRYKYRNGGLFIQSTLSDEIYDNSDLWTSGIFDKNDINGLLLSFASFNTSMCTDGNANWKTKFARKKINGTLHGYFGEPDKKELQRVEQSSDDNRAYISLLVEDTIGARAIIATDGLAVYDQTAGSDTYKGDYKGETAAWSVDQAGNMQTRGSEVRSNAIDTSWYWHTRWPNTTFQYPVLDETALRGGINWSPGILITSPGYNEDGAPLPNQLIYGTDKTVIFRDENSADDQYNKLWRANNFSDICYSDGSVTPYNMTNIIDVPAGWLVNTGFLSSDNKNRIAFDVDQLNQFGSNELMPTIIYETADLRYQKGALTVRNPHVSALMMTYDNSYYRGRFSINANYGMVVGNPARGTIQAIAEGEEFSPNHLFSTVLSIPVESKRLTSANPLRYNHLGNRFNSGKTETKIDGTDVNMFAYADRDDTETLASPRADVGLWVIGSSYTDEHMVVGKDLIVNRFATVRGQVRATSFRRHVNGANYGNTEVSDNDSSYCKSSIGALMTDVGYSMATAPEYTSMSNNDWVNITIVKEISQTSKWSSDNDVQSPIIYDLGQAYGSKRLVKFGTVAGVKLEGEDNDLMVRVPDESYKKDHHTLLLGTNPYSGTSSIMKEGYLYSEANPRNLHKMTVSAVCGNMMAIVNISVAMDAKFKARDYHRAGWFGGRRFVRAFGFAWRDQIAKFRYDEQADRLPSGQDQGSTYGSCLPSCVCTGFDWNTMLGEDFPKPLQDQYVFIPSVFRSCQKHNWDDDGNHAHRATQIGVWFRLTTKGLLEIATANYPGAISNTRQNVTLSFAYPVVMSNDLVQFFIACSTRTSITPGTCGELYANLQPFSALSDEGFQTWAQKQVNAGNYVWIKTFTSTSGEVNYNDISWENYTWTLYEQPSTQKGVILYAVTQAVDENFPYDDNGDIITTAGVKNSLPVIGSYTPLAVWLDESGVVQGPDQPTSNTKMYPIPVDQDSVDDMDMDDLSESEKKIVNAYITARDKLLNTYTNNNASAVVYVQCNTSVVNPHTNKYSDGSEIGSDAEWNILASVEENFSTDVSTVYMPKYINISAELKKSNIHILQYDSSSGYWIKQAALTKNISMNGMSDYAFALDVTQDTTLVDMGWCLNHETSTNKTYWGMKLWLGYVLQTYLRQPVENGSYDDSDRDTNVSNMYVKSKGWNIGGGKSQNIHFHGIGDALIIGNCTVQSDDKKASSNADLLGLKGTLRMTSVNLYPLTASLGFRLGNIEWTADTVNSLTGGSSYSNSNRYIVMYCEDFDSKYTKGAVVTDKQCVSNADAYAYAIPWVDMNKTCYKVSEYDEAVDL